jgi:hypothetical protein
MASTDYSKIRILEAILFQLRDIKLLFGTEKEVSFKYWENIALLMYVEIYEELKIEVITEILRDLEKEKILTIVLEATENRLEIIDKIALTEKQREFTLEDFLKHRVDYLIIIHESFDDYYYKKILPIIKELELSEKVKMPELPNVTNNYYIVLKNKEILLNGVMAIGKPQIQRDSEILFNYLYENPNQTFTKKELEDTLKIKINSSFAKIINRLGFVRDLGKQFFETNKSTIKFKNPIQV